MQYAGRVRDERMTRAAIPKGEAAARCRPAPRHWQWVRLVADALEDPAIRARFATRENGKPVAARSVWDLPADYCDAVLEDLGLPSWREYGASGLVESDEERAELFARYRAVVGDAAPPVLTDDDGDAGRRCGCPD